MARRGDRGRHFNLLGLDIRLQTMKEVRGTGFLAMAMENRPESVQVMAENPGNFVGIGRLLFRHNELLKTGERLRCHLSRCA